MTLQKRPARRGGQIIKSQHLIKGNFALERVLQASSASSGSVEVKSVQAGTHRVEHGSL